MTAKRLSESVAVVSNGFQSYAGIGREAELAHSDLTAP